MLQQVRESFMKSRLCGIALILASAMGCSAAEPAGYRVYVGTYTQGSTSRGIYSFDLDTRTGQTTPPRLAGEATNPSFLALHPTGRYLYATGEIGQYQGRSSGSVSAYAIDANTGALTPINTEPSGGGGPCHLNIDAGGRNLLVANYGGGSAACLPLGEGGKLMPAKGLVQFSSASGVNPRRQEAPHAHSINLDPEGRVAFIADLGADRVYAYAFDAQRGELSPHDPPFVATPPGGGPRHFAFHPSKPFAYTNNELTSSVTAMRWDKASRSLQPFQTLSTLPHDFSGNNTTAEVLVHPGGQFLYVSNRGHDSLAIFQIDRRNGRLTPAGHAPTGGKTPRNFTISPDGAWLLAANQDSDTVVLFRVDRASGQLSPIGDPIAVPRPVCVRLLPLPSSAPSGR